MKKIYTFLSIVCLSLGLMNCSDLPVEESSSMGNTHNNEEDRSASILALVNSIQNSSEDHINLEEIRERLIQLDNNSISTTDSTSFIVELNMTDKEIKNKELIVKLNNKYGKPLVDHELSSWFLKTKSGKELEVSIIDYEDHFTLRFLLRSYL